MTAIKKASSAKASKPSDTELELARIGALERALAATVGIDVAQFNPIEIQAARDKQLAEAQEKAARILEDAEKFEVELTPKQRLERLERAARSAGVQI